MRFFIPMIPPTTTAQMHKVTMQGGKPRFYDPPEVKAMKAKLTAHLAKYRPDKPMEGAIRLYVMWCYPRGTEHRDGEYKITKPDTDNLQKALKDCMTKLGYWHDDAQVASEQAEKFWAAKPGLFVEAYEMEGTNDGR